MAKKNPVSKEEILAAIRKCAEKLGRAPSTRELKRFTGGAIDVATIERRLVNYSQALQLCGLTRQDAAKPHCKTELFAAWATLARRVNRLPRMREIGLETGISHCSYLRKFGKWSKVPEGMLKMMEEQKLEKKWRDVAELIRAQSAKAAIRPVTPIQQVAGKRKKAAAELETILPGEEYRIEGGEVRQDRPLYGAPINHPCMANAPINEDGVLGLFVAMARELGFIITRVQAPFPDIEALRLENGRYRRTLIEVEFESRTFLAHGHDPKGCDLIVCWKHNWKECPLPVLELSKLFKS